MSKKKNRNRNHNNQLSNNQVISNKTDIDLSSELSSELPSDNENTDSIVIDNDPAEGEVVVDETVNDEIANSESTNSESANTEILDTEALNDENEINELVIDEAVVDEITEAVDVMGYSDKNSIADNSSAESLVEEEEKEKEEKVDNGQTFGEFSKEFFGHIKSVIIKNRIKVIILTSFAAITTLVCVLVYVLTNGKNSAQTSVSASATEVTAVSDNNLIVPEDEYEVNAYPEVNDLMQKYFTARQGNDVSTLTAIQKNITAVESAKYEVLSKYIDEFTLKNCYTKKGPFENSYMVYATFDVKMTGYDVLAPGLQTFVVCTAEDGSLYIYSGDFDSNIADYISEISAQDDVIELMNRVSVEYNDILASNSDFSDYMGTFKTTIKSEIGEKIAQLEVAETTESSGDSLEASDDNVDVQPTEDNNNENESFVVKTTTSVNVRKSDSESADKLGTVGAGATLTCNKEKANGWSEVVYEGEIGYIKSEYLVKADGEAAGITTNGTLMINETIKIRKEPSTDADSYGVGYAGQTFEKIESLDNGWTKILFEGKEAYIKSEFIVQ